MKLFIDALMISYSGVGRYVQNIIEKIDSISKETGIKLTVFLNQSDEKYLSKLPNSTLLYTPVNTKIYSIKEQLFLRHCLKKSKPDLVHFPNFNVALFSRMPFVVTIHDLIYLKFPGACPNILAKTYARFMINYACRKAKLVITDSLFSKQDILETMDIPGSKIRVIYPAVSPKYQPITDPHRRLAKYKIPKKYILYVGNHEKRKNIPALMAAFARSKSSRQYHLVITGKKDSRRKEIYQTINQYHLESRIFFTDYLSEEDLPALYSGAGLLAFPSVYEGFGLPILEAMACGTPVICSNATSIPEVAGNAALVVDPANLEEFAVAIDRVLTDDELRHNLQEKGLIRAKQFDWSKTVMELIKVYQEALNEDR